MKTATLKQGKKVLELLEDLPIEQLQELLESGLLSDLLIANVGEMNRDEFRKLCGLSPILPTLHLIPTFDRDMRKEGWTLEKDIEDKEGEFTPELLNVFKEEEQSISGEELLKRAEEKDACLGQRHAEAMLRQQQTIPKEWRENYLVFPGTVWVASDGRRFVPYLSWHVCGWHLTGHWLVSHLHRCARLVRSRK